MRIGVVLFGLAMLVHWLSADAVILQKTVTPGENDRGRAIGDVLLGKKKKNRINPVSVFLLDKGEVGLVDQVHGRVVITEGSGRIIKEIGKAGNRRFGSPVSGSSDGRGNFYVSDSELRIVAVFSSPYRFVREISFDEETRVTGIFFHDGWLFCADTGRHRVIVADVSGRIIRSFGGRGNGPGEFNYPTHICADSDYIYVTDALNFRVQMFSRDGAYVRSFGKNGRKGGEFSMPKGIAVDSRKRIFITDVMFDNVQVFDLQGRFLTYFGTPGSGDGDFWVPSGIMIDSRDNIYVADTYNHRYKIYRVDPE